MSQSPSPYGRGLYVVESEAEEEEKPPEFSWLDVLAFTIAAYQLLLPVVAALIGVGLALYFVLWLLAR